VQLVIVDLLSAWYNHAMSERKYVQRGYQDRGDERAKERRGPEGPSSRPPGPRGRGLGKPSVDVCRCAVCGARQDASDLAPGSKCSKCGTDLHTCTHCVHFDASAAFECRQPVTARVANKARENDCRLFEARSTQETSGDRAAPSDPKAAFDALFKNL
jgi:hypothetical protein